MVITLRESTARLPELVARAGEGEDILISFQGRVRARITACPPLGVDTRGPKTVDQIANPMTGWAEELLTLHDMCSTGRTTMTSEEILAEMREDRV